MSILLDSMETQGATGVKQEPETSSANSMAASYRRQRVFKWTGEANLSDWVWSTIGDVDEYVAISHTWGSESNLTTKIIAGVLLQVSTWKHDNLEQWIQKNLSGIWIWMDILCIPQDDGEECISACLQSIPQVFNAAECVHVLLEDHTPLKLPTYEEFDEMHARNNMEYRATDPQTRRLPIMELFKQWADDNRAFLPKLAWLQRLWTRQEAQYSSKICFHGVATATGPSMGRNSSPKTDIQPFGPIGQLSSSLVGDRWDLMCKIFIELAAGRGTPVAGLGGIQRQRIGGLVMAFCELRAARRATKKSQDYVLALFPTFDWYVVPDAARRYSTFELLSDALRQAESATNQVILRPTMDGIFHYQRLNSGTGQERMFQLPHNSFDFFSTFTIIGACQRQADGSTRLFPSSLGQLVEWSEDADHRTWMQTLSAICIEREMMSQERHYAMEALMEELHITGVEEIALREFVVGRNADSLAALPNRREVVAWITCVHLVISHTELKRVTSDGACLMLTKVIGNTRSYPTIVAPGFRHAQTFSIYSAPSSNRLSADIAFLGYQDGDKSCRIIGSLGSYLNEPSRAGPREYHLATNGWDFWVARHEERSS